MAIRRSPLRKDQPWTTFSNELLQDPELRHDALGVLVYLISKPEDWTVQATELARRFKCGRDGIYRIMNDLIAAGYAQREQDRQKGKFAERCFIVFNEKQPLPEKPETAEPDTVNPTLQSKDSTKDRNSAPKARKPNGQHDYGETFEQLWIAYGRYGNKKPAAQEFNKLSPELQAEVIAAVPAYLKAVPKDKTGREMKFNLERFIANEVYKRHATPESVKRELPAPESIPRKRWEIILGAWRRNGKWHEVHGPAPAMPGSHVPLDLLTEEEIEDANTRLLGGLDERRTGQSSVPSVPERAGPRPEILGASGLEAAPGMDTGRLPCGLFPGVSAGHRGGSEAG